MDSELGVTQRTVTGVQGAASVLTLLQRLQWALLCLIVILSPTTYRNIIWQATTQSSIFPEFRGVVLFLPDYALALLIVVSVLRWLWDRPFHAGLKGTLRIILYRLGGEWWIALAAWMSLSIVWAGERGLALYNTLHLLAGLALALLLADFVRKGWGRSALLLLITAAGVQSIIAIGQAAYHGPLGLWALDEINWPPEPTFRGGGLTVNFNNLAGYLLIALAGCAALLQERAQNARWLALPLLAGLFIIGGLVATLSRGAALGGLVAFVLLLSRMRQFRFQIPRRLLIILGIMVLVISVWGATLVAANLGWRLNLNRDFFLSYALPVMLGSPVLGAGAGNAMLEVGRLYPDTVAVPILLPVHDVYLLLWAELGIPGMVLFILASLAIVLRLRSQININAFIWGCCFLAFCIIGLFDYYFWGDLRSQLLMFWVIGMWWGSATANYNRGVSVQGKQP